MKSEEPYWRIRPGGLSTIAFKFPTEPRSNKQTGYYNFDFFITINKDPGVTLASYTIPEDIKGTENILGYYWANQFDFIGGNLKGVDGYMGIQTTGDIHTFDPSNRNIPSCNRFVKWARIALFSIWGALDANPGPTNSYCAPFGHEGSGWSCKVEYLWRTGVKYCLRVVQLPGTKKPDEPAWWRGIIIDTSTRQETIIGDIQVPAEWSCLRKDASVSLLKHTNQINK